MKTKKSQLIVVLGMHRSGTSVITKSLELLGVGLGSDLHPAGLDNPKGFWEDKECISINENLLHHLGSAYDRLDFAWREIVFDETVTKLKLKAVQLILLRLSENNNIWGFKDPRTCRLMAFWKEVFREVDCDVSYIIQIRNPASVAASLETRNGIDKRKSYYLWLQHVLPSLLFTQNSSRIVVDYDDFLVSPYSQLTRISEKLGFQLLTAGSSAINDFEHNFLDFNLRHTNFTEADLLNDKHTPEVVILAYRILKNVANDLESLENASVQKKIHNLNENIKQHLPAFEYINILEDSLSKQARVIDEQASVIDEQARVKDEIYASSSWRITRPLRCCTQWIRSLK
jgi:hypothetical protein